MADEFKPEFDALAQNVRREILVLTLALQEFGPQLGRPRVDTLKGSRHSNMNELRFSAADGDWLSLLTPGGKRFYSWAETNPAGAKSASIVN